MKIVHLSPVIFSGILFSQGIMAENLPVILDKEAAEKALIGTRQSGYFADTRVKAEECVDAKGDTWYVTSFIQTRGRATFRSDGYVCYRYEYDAFKDESCFRVFKWNDGRLSFRTDDGVTFHATKIEHGVSSCADEFPMS